MDVRKAAAVPAALVVLGLPVPAQAAARAPQCDRVVEPGRVSREPSWADRLYDQRRLAPLSTGAGVRVAVVDSGVDATHPQLNGRVEPGRDFLRGADARQDCVGHGTGVASLIAARPVDDVGLRGLAPDARIVPVRISEQTQQQNGDLAGDPADVPRFADAIRWAADPAGGDADVINLSLVMTRDEPRIRRAVAAAVDAGAVVVAAAGNNGGPDQANPTPYPAAYPDVIGVGSLTEAGVRAASSQHGEYVDIMAAGENVTAAAPGSGHEPRQGTSFAAPYVSATAALIMSRYPDATPGEVRRRLLATTDPAPGDRPGDRYGYGLLNPYRALTETLAPDGLAPPPKPPVRGEDPAVLALRARRAEARERALVVAAAGGALVVAALVSVAVVRHGRRRRWRPATG